MAAAMPEYTRELEERAAAEEAERQRLAALPQKAGVFALKNNGGFQEDGASPYSVGTRVLARYARGSEWFPGVVTKVVSGGLMSIAYDDGGKETRVHAAYVKPLVTAAGATAGAAAADEAGRCIVRCSQACTLALLHLQLKLLVGCQYSRMVSYTACTYFSKLVPLRFSLLACTADGSSDDSSSDSDDESFARRASQQQQQWDVVMKKPKKTSMQREVAREVATNNDKNRKKRQAKREKELIARELQRASL
eukprot:17426-Heterococcus_DN1.PRE.1